MKAICLSVRVEDETLDTFKSIAAMKGCTLSKLLGEALDEWVEFFAQAEMESEVEAQAGIPIPPQGFQPDAQTTN